MYHSFSPTDDAAIYMAGLEKKEREDEIEFERCYVWNCKCHATKTATDGTRFCDWHYEYDLKNQEV